MASLEFKIEGAAATAFSDDQRGGIYTKILERYASSIQTTILEGFNRSNELLQYAGSAGDPEAVKAILRSIKVSVIPGTTNLEAKFADDLGHWYGGGDLPDSVVKILQDIMDESIDTWFRSEEPSNIVSEELVG